MGMVVRTNTMALNAYRQLGMNNNAVTKSLEKLSSGFRINRAGDDAAGLAISEKMKAQITGLETASANAQDGISLIQTAEGNLNEVHSMLNRMVELASKSANGTYTSQERQALQDEVNSLLDEIDRISKSANFNGTKLLDGTMGLNQEVFSKFTEVDAIKATTGDIDISKLVAKEADGSPKVHMEGSSVAAATPSATIDLGDLKVTGSKDGDKMVINVAGTDYTIEAAADGDFDTTTKIAGLLVAELNKGINSADGTTTSANAMKIGDAAFTAAVAGDTITLTYAGSTVGGAWKNEAAFSGDAASADKINKALGFDVQVKSVTTAAGMREGDVIHKAINVAQAAAKVDATKAGIDINLAELVKEGNTLTIDGTTFIFKVGADSEIEDAGVAGGSTATGKDADGNTIIDVSTAKTPEEAVHKAADLLSKQTIAAATAGDGTRTWKIGVNGDGTTIHIDQTTASKTGSELKSYDDVVGVIKAKGTPTEAKSAGTQITVDPSKINSGDSLKIGDKKYVFTKDADTEIEKDAVRVVMGDDPLAALKTEVDKSEYNVEITDGADGKKLLTVYSDKTDATTAPIVAGGGLTLQIGDTADIFNKMSVTVADMSSKGLGLEHLKEVGIMTESSASDAIDTIKKAINTVSSTRAGMGALQNRLEHTINNLDVAVENLSAANSRIRDTDMAKEMMNYTKMNVLVQSAQAMLAQANQQPQSVLQLLQ